MCCFSLPVRFVGGTRIFARGLDANRQVLVYAMQLQLDTALAMVLPIPTPPRAQEDSVGFVDLSGYPRFFDDLGKAFPPAFLPAKRGGLVAPAAAPAPARLAVHKVGSFEASFVPHPDEFVRLDPRFRLPPAFWSALPNYADWGFVVVKLAPRRRLLNLLPARQTIHPLAFTFPRRDPTALFFPTLHVHDGAVHARARFDHELYCQPDDVVARLVAWTRSTQPIAATLDLTRARGLVDERKNALRNVLVGELENRDIVLRTPAGISLSDLDGRGRTFRYEVHAQSAVYDPMGVPALAALCRGLRDGLAAFEREHAAAFRLTELHDDLPPHFLNGPDVWSGNHFFDGTPATPGGRGRLVVWVDVPPHETQWITFGFEALPDAPGITRLRDAVRTAITSAARTLG